MNYTELTAAISDTVENSFTATQLARFVQQAEKKIYRTVQLPLMRQSSTVSTVSGTTSIAIPSTLLNVRSMAVTTGGYEYLQQKEVSFIREAFPDPAATGEPRFYAFLDVDSFILGPTPNAVYSIEIQYDAYPTSIVTAGTTWLGTEFDNALLNGALIEAVRFTKGEDADVKLYQALYVEAITLLADLNEKIKQDAYRPVGGARI